LNAQAAGGSHFQWKGSNKDAFINFVGNTNISKTKNLKENKMINKEGIIPTMIKELDYCINLFIEIIDFNELDLGQFLINEEYKKYKKNIFVRNTSLIAYYLLFISGFIFMFFIGLEILFILLIISYIPMMLLLRVSIILRKLRYLKSLYRQERKIMLNHYKILNFLLYNSTIMENIEKSDQKKNYIEKFKELQDRLTSYSTTFKTTSKYFEQFSLISLISVLIGILINVIPNFLMTQWELNVFEIVYIFTVLFMIIYISGFLSLNSKITKKRLYKKRVKLKANKALLDTAINNLIKKLKEAL